MIAHRVRAVGFVLCIIAVRCWFSVIPANVNYRLRFGGRRCANGSDPDPRRVDVLPPQAGRVAAVMREHVAYRCCLVLLKMRHKSKTFQPEPDFSRLKSSTLDLSCAKDVPCGASPQSSQRSRLLRVIGGGTSSLPARLRRDGGTSPLRTTHQSTCDLAHGTRHY